MDECSHIFFSYFAFVETTHPFEQACHVHFMMRLRRHVEVRVLMANGKEISLASDIPHFCPAVPSRHGVARVHAPPPCMTPHTQATHPMHSSSPFTAHDAALDASAGSSVVAPQQQAASDKSPSVVLSTLYQLQTIEITVISASAAPEDAESRFVFADVATLFTRRA